MTLRQLCKKDVVQLGSGVKLGRADDLELEMGSAQVCSLILRGRPRWFGLLGRGEDMVIPWQQIETIGEDVILVNCPVQDLPPRPEEDGLRAIFHNFVSS
ncbi:YlmC/YmxH family sporulation protein [Allofournierella massiliensis]|uniref:YlmC/YmxH family sporulation protein n=1 Tax=Allofournierella massiliensis TaxID=1650663 RepID=UPI00320A7585